MKSQISIVLLGLISIFITSCSQQKAYVSGETNYYLTDFRPYSEEGFFITTEPPQGNYTPVGLVEVEILQGAIRQQYKARRAEDGSIEYDLVWVKETLYPQSAIDSLVKMAKDLGADAITKFEKEVDYRNTNFGVDVPDLLAVRVSGFAIKRNE